MDSGQISKAGGGVGQGTSSTLNMSVLGCLRTSRSFDSLKVNPETSFTVTGIESNEIGSVLEFFKNIENIYIKNRAINSLRSAIEQREDCLQEIDLLLNDLRLQIEDPVLWHLRRFKSLEQFSFDADAFYTFSSITDEEYEVVFNYIKGIEDRGVQKRVCRMLYPTIKKKSWGKKALKGIDTFIKDLTLREQEPVLWHLRKFGSLDDFRFDFETSFTFTSIEEGEYEGVLACLKTIDDEPQKRRAIKGLYKAIALKQLCGGFQDKCRALKVEFSDRLKTHEISGREVLKQSDAMIKGIDKSGGEKVFYAFSGTKVCSDSPQNNAKRKAFLQEIRGHCQECLSGQEQWLNHFYLDRADGIGDKDFLNFNAQHTCDFKEVKILKEKF